VDLIVIHGLGGDDEIDVSAGAVGFTNVFGVQFTIFGEGGNDTIKLPGGVIGGPHFASGGGGEDILYGGSGNDTINGDDDSDWIEGGGGNDTLHGNGGDDWYISGDSDDDQVFGDAGNDEVRGGSGNDRVFGGAGEDEVYGESGKDWTFSNTTPGNADQPFFPTVGRLSMEGSGGADCDIEDGYIECPFNVAGNIGIGGSLVVSAPGVIDCYDGLGLTAALATDADPGDVSLNSNGSFTYSISGSPPSSDTFEYTLSDGTNTSLPTTATLTLTNPPPTAVNDSSYSFYGHTSNGLIADAYAPSTGVLANDTDPTNDSLTATKVSDVSHGMLTLNSNGTFSYTPTVGYVGTDSFTYTASDGHSSSNTATVTITVQGTAPSAANDGTYYVTTSMMGGSYSLSSPGVLSNDSDSDGQTLAAKNASTPTHGSVTLNANGSFSYLSPMGFTGSATFTYQAYDGWLYSSTATVSFVVSNPLMFAGDPADSGSADGVSLDDVQLVMAAAAQRWVMAGVSSSSLSSMLAGVTIVITDLPGSQLAGVAGDVLLVDADAAGYGWYLDTSDDDFTSSGDNERTANANSAAAGRVDLLTALSHELGHLLGLEHDDSAPGLMNDELALGIRCTPSSTDAALLDWAGE
jgi:VCBS repeat-containing protein